jgi:hypothetical protein
LAAEKTQSFCPCSRALNRSGKGLILKLFKNYVDLDLCYVCQLHTLIRIVFKDRSVKEEMLKTMSLREKTRGEDIFQSLFTNLSENKVSVPMPVSIEKEDPPPVTIENLNVGLGR